VWTGISTPSHSVSITNIAMRCVRHIKQPEAYRVPFRGTIDQYDDERMPRIIDYEQVLTTLTSRGLTSLYHNSGSFGFAGEEHFCGWLGTDDPTIRESMRAFCKRVSEPTAVSLERLFTLAWSELLPGPVWIMPGSHWAYELDFGSATWLPKALQTLGIDSAALQPRNNASAIELDPSEEKPRKLVGWLLENLSSSDFTAAFPSHPAICTIHHHRQLWWRTSDAALRDRLLALREKAEPGGDRRAS
jgi:hypothetical protein